jgi:MinD superfamily P-loop ATPase
MKITIASGKGGTGKTTFAVNLAYSLAAKEEKVRLLDCDVEEPDDHLFVNPKFSENIPVNVQKPVLIADKCTGCGKCAEACNYNAIAVVKGKVLIFNELCHSCGVCSYVCPEGALQEKPYSIGTVQTALDETDEQKQLFPFVHGLLNIGEALAPAIVRQVKEYIDPEAINIIDASPGTSCPVVEAVKGADVAVLVTEPTPFGLNDLKLAVGLTLKMGVPTGIVVNRSNGKDEIIREYAESVGVPIIGRIPFKREYAESYSRGDMLAASFPELKENLLAVFVEITKLIGGSIPDIPEEDEVSLTKKASAPLAKGTAKNCTEIAVISGKGGTGKTTVVSSLALLSRDKVLADNDVDAADLHLLLGPSTYEARDFIGGKTPAIDSTKCTGCGLCADNCHFDAILPDGSSNDFTDVSYRIDELACEGCGLCGYVCPVGAIDFHDNITGRWFASETRYGPMAHARLGIAEENSGKLVTQVRKRASELARERGYDKILSDGPPGTGCPVIASVSGVDLVLIVTEPTVSGVHDMERVLKLSAHFGVPSLVIINKADLNAEQARKINRLTEEAGSRVIGEIPFDHNVNEALMNGKTIIEHGRGPALEAVRAVWDALRKVAF